MAVRTKGPSRRLARFLDTLAPPRQKRFELTNVCYSTFVLSGSYNFIISNALAVFIFEISLYVFLSIQRQKFTWPETFLFNKIHFRLSCTKSLATLVTRYTNQWTNGKLKREAWNSLTWILCTSVFKLIGICPRWNLSFLLLSLQDSCQATITN